MTEQRETCGATTVFWPDVEACEAVCVLPSDHQPANVHRDEILDEWDEDEMPTERPGRDD